MQNSRSRSPEEKDSNSEPERPQSPSPIPRIVNEEWYHSAHAVFVKRWYRGRNTCSRCDLEYVPVRGQQPQRRLEDKASKTSHQQHHHQQYHLQQHQQPMLNKAVPGSSSLVKEIKEEKKPDIKREERVRESPVPRKKSHYDMAPSSDAQITSSLMGGTAFPPYVLDHPAFRGYPMMHDPTPALRQLSEYAKPHIGGGGANPDRTAVPGSGFDPFSRFPGLYQPSSKERLDLETDKRGERVDARNRDSWEAKEKIKSEMDFKPQDRTPSYPSVGLLDAHLFELQKRYGSAMPPGGVTGNLPPVNLPGIFPPTSLAAEWMRREKERLEFLGAGGVMPNLSAVDASLLSERLLAERFHAEHLNERLMLPADPIYRLEMAGLGTANVTEQSHTTHTHSHTHLHLHQPDAAAAAAAALYPPFHPLVASAPHLLPSPGFALPAVGVNPLAGGNHSAPGIVGALPIGPPVPHPAYSFAASQQLMAAARDQDLLYRELLSRPPYSTDPILNQQLTAQAIAHQEAVQRQLAVERDRLGASFHGAVMPR